MRPASDSNHHALAVRKRGADWREHVKLPTWIKVVCRADGTPLTGGMAQVTIRVRRKNDFTVPFGPTDDSGTALITLPEIEEWAEMERNAFPMDFTGLGDFTGELVATVKSRESLMGALGAYDMFHGSLRYPRGYADKLREAKRVLDQIAPATLTVDVQHDGEGITVRTPDVPA
jgi:hypothetical protein